MSFTRVVDLAFSAAFLGAAVYGVSELFGSIGDPRGWLPLSYAVGIAYALFSALRAATWDVSRERARREVARERWHAS